MIEWLNANPDVAAAIATILLTVFGGIQVALEIGRRADRTRSAVIEAEGPAWLARRSFQAALSSAVDATSGPSWATWMSGDTLDRLERQMLEVLRLASIAGGEHAIAARVAFEGFVTFADRVNALAVLRPTGSELLGTRNYSASDLDSARQLLSDAFAAAGQSWTALTRLAPFRPNEPQPPQRNEVLLLMSSESAAK